MKHLRALFIEDDADLAELLKPHYSQLFEACEYQVIFHDARGEKDARRLIESVDPHILICDLGLDRDYDGLHLIRTIRTHYPDLFVIGTSRGDYSPRNVDARQPSFHMFIDKQPLLEEDKKYLPIAIERFLELFRLETSIEIANFDTLRTDEFQKPSSRRELNALMRQIMFSGHQPDDLMHPNQIYLEPIGGGFSGSQVFKMTSRNSTSSLVCVPSVLKISERKYAEQELENYHRFVKWGLPYTWRVDLLGSGFTKSYGAIAYSFILSDLKKFDSLTELLRRQEDPRVLQAVQTLFSPEMRRWYGDPLIRPEANIVERFAGRYFRGAEAKGLCEKRFLDVAQSAFGAKVSANKIEIFGRTYEKPTTALFGYPMGRYQSCICHGDLNSNNVMVAENEQTIFIDFQETGRGHVFEDFVTMEASVRLYHGEDGLRGEALLEAERHLGNGADVAGLGRMHRLAAEIRRLAEQNFPSEPFATYHYASAAFNFRLLRIQNLSDRQAERAVAAVLAGLGNLQRPRRS